MIHTILPLILLKSLLFIYSKPHPDPEILLRYAETINVEDLYEHVAVLAADSLEGRETGERGQKIAADYIKKYFIQNELKPVVNSDESLSYFQKFNLVKSYWDDVYVKFNNNKIKNFDGIIRYGKKEVPEELSNKLVFVGNGTEKEIDANDVDGKAILFISLEPYTWAKKVEYARTKGAQAFFVVNTASEADFKSQAENLKHYLTEPKVGFSPQPSGESVVFYTSPNVAGKIFNTKYEKLKELVKKEEKNNNPEYKLKPVNVAYKALLKYEEVETENVLGFIEGKEKKDEIIVITAHYDHIGMSGDGEVFNGADDDASGTSAVMEIAQAFALAKKDGFTPQRSILFMMVTGEEKGLLGSQYYTNNPVFPLENTVANLNIDMIGRMDQTYKDDPHYVYLIGSDKLSQELHDLSEEMNTSFTNLKLDYRYNDDRDPNRFYYRSDHYNFAKHNIPVIFYFNGTHEDYHQVTDTIDKINFEKMEKISRLVFYTAWELANRPERIALKSN